MPDSSDLSQRLLAQLRFPCGEVPNPAPIKKRRARHIGCHAAPSSSTHINLWAGRGEGRLTIVDTGINTQATGACGQIFANVSAAAGDARRRHVHPASPDHVAWPAGCGERWTRRVYMTLGGTERRRRRNDFIENEDLRAAHLGARRAGREDALFHRQHGWLTPRGSAPCPRFPAHAPRPSRSRSAATAGRVVGRAMRRARLAVVSRAQCADRGRFRCAQDQHQFGVCPTSPRRCADLVPRRLLALPRLPADALVLPPRLPVRRPTHAARSAGAHHDARLNDMATSIARNGAKGATGWTWSGPLPAPSRQQPNVFAFGETLAHSIAGDTSAR